MAYLSILNRISWCRSSSALWRCWMYSRSSSEMWGFPAQFLFFLLMSLASHEPIWLWQSLNIDYFSLFWTVENNFIKTNQSKYSIFNLHHNQIGIKLLLNFSRFTIIVNFDSLVSTHLLNILQQHSALQLNLIGFFCSRKKNEQESWGTVGCNWLVECIDRRRWHWSHWMHLIQGMKTSTVDFS